MNEPRFQYSVFSGNNRKEQFVIRADNKEEFIQLKNDLDEIMSNRKSQVTPPTNLGSSTGQINVPYIPPATYTPVVANTPDDMQKLQLSQPCRKCGGPMVLNPKTQKVFCKAKCWLK